MNTLEQQAISERAYRQAMEIIRQEWLAAGKTEEELTQEEQIAELYDNLLASGCEPKQIRAEWQGKTNAEILRAYTVPVPVLQSV